MVITIKPTTATTIIALGRLTSSSNRTEEDLPHTTTTTLIATLLLNDNDANLSRHNLHALSLTQAQRASAKKA
jgi:hypothetical protein